MNWISVEDELPKTCREYFIKFRFLLDQKIVIRMGRYIPWDKQWTYPAWVSADFKVITENVTHWSEIERPEVSSSEFPAKSESVNFKVHTELQSLPIEAILRDRINKLYTQIEELKLKISEQVENMDKLHQEIYRSLKVFYEKIEPLVHREPHDEHNEESHWRYHLLSSLEYFIRWYNHFEMEKEIEHKRGHNNGKEISTNTD